MQSIGQVRPNVKPLATFFILAFALLLTPSLAQAADQTDEKVAGIIGIIRGQTVRLSLSNVGDASIIPLGPCASRLAFLDTANNLLGATTVNLTPGQSAFADLNADTLPMRGRLEIQGVAHFPPNTDPTLPDACADTRLTLELIDNKSLLTIAFAPEPHLADSPEPERRAFGMVGITAGQELRLYVNNLCDGSVVHLCDGSVTPAPCATTLSFLDVNGRDLMTPVAMTLNSPGDNGFADLLAAHGIIINDKTRLQARGLVSFPRLSDPTAFNPCANVRATIEVFNTKTGQTSVFYQAPEL